MIVTKRIALNTDLYCDFVSFIIRDSNAILSIDKFWLEPKSNEASDWVGVINRAQLNVITKQMTKGILESKQSFRIDIKLDPFQKFPIVDLKKQINGHRPDDFSNETQFFIDVFLSIGEDLRSYNMFLQMSFEDTYLEIIDCYDESNPIIIDGINIRHKIAQVKQMDPTLEDYHDILWLCKSLQKKQLKESDIPKDVFSELIKTPIYRRMFN